MRCRSKEGKVAKQRERSADTGRRIATAGRRTIESVFHHPDVLNLSWTDVLHVLKLVGTVEQRPDGKYSLWVNGKHLVFHKTHGKHLEAHEIRELRGFFASARLSPDDIPELETSVPPTSVDIALMIDHHEAKLYKIHGLSSQDPETIRPNDLHHFLHHLHHRDEFHERGQRPAEDLTFYERIAEALSRADRIVLLSHGCGVSNAADVLVERLQKHHPDICARIVLQARADTSAMTEPEILAYARRALAVDPDGQP
jgi:hypothetical protein